MTGNAHDDEFSFIFAIKWPYSALHDCLCMLENMIARCTAIHRVKLTTDV